MYVVLIIFLILFIALSVFYYRQLENANKEIYNLECKLDNSNYKSKQFEKKIAKLEEENENAMNYSNAKIKRKLYELVFQTPNYNSVEDLQNKIKTVLASNETN